MAFAHRHSLAQLLLLTLLICLPLESHAQTQTLESIAQQLDLGKTQNKVTLEQGKFVQRKYLKILPNPLTSSGQYTFQVESGLAWEVLQPLHSKITFSTEGISQEQNGQQVWLARSDQPGVAVIGQIMAAIFTNDWQTLKQFFSIEIQPSTQAPGSTENQNWSLILTPTQTTLAAAMNSIQLSGGQQLQHMTLFEPNGDRTEIDFQP